MSIKKYFSKLFFLVLFSSFCCSATIKFIEHIPAGSFKTTAPRQFYDYLMGHVYDWRISEAENIQRVLIVLKNAKIDYQLNGNQHIFFINSVGNSPSWEQLVLGNFYLEVTCSIFSSGSAFVCKGEIWMNGSSAKPKGHQNIFFDWNSIQFDFSDVRATEEWKRKTYQPTQAEIKERFAKEKLAEEKHREAQREFAEKAAKQKELNDLILAKTQSQIDDISRKKSDARKAKQRAVIKELGGSDPENFTCLTAEALEKYRLTMSIYDLAENAKCDLEIEHIKLKAESDIAREQQELIDGGVQPDSDSQHSFDREFDNRSNYTSDADETFASQRNDSSANDDDPKGKKISIKKRWILASGVLITLPVGLYFKKIVKRKKNRKFGVGRKRSKKNKKRV